MAANIESRIEALEAKLVPVDPRERLIIFLMWTSAVSGGGVG